jgi:predicted metal-dependent hydrolase
MDVLPLPPGIVARPAVRARRLTLRIRPADGVAELAVPPGMPPDAVLDFARRNAAWAAARIARLPAPVALVPGAEIEVLGRRVRLRHAPDRRGSGEDAEGIWAGGPPQRAPRLFALRLQETARAALVPRVRHHAERLGRTVRSVRIADPAGRWGSCSADGRIMLSWRLVLAPVEVADYVCAHEAAHLVTMDHSPRFWRTLDSIFPRRAAAEAWLRRHGDRLHRISLG